MVFLAALTQLVYFYPEMIDQKFTVHPPHEVSTSLPSDTHIFPLFDLQLVAPPLICAPLLILGAVQRGVGGRYGEFGGGVMLHHPDDPHAIIPPWE